MKKMQWKLKLDFASESEKKDTNEKKLFENFILAALRLGFRDGLSPDYQRRLFKVMDKLDAVDPSCDNLDLEDAEFEMIKEAFDRAKFPPDNFRVVCQIYDFIELANNSEKKKE